MAAPAYESVSTQAEPTTQTTSTTVTKPSGTVDDDYLIAWCYTVRNSDPQQPSPPGGWTTIASGTHGGRGGYGLFWKKASSEGASYAFTCTSAAYWQSGIVRVSGSGGVDVSGTNSGNGSTYTAPSVTTTVDDCLVLYFWGLENDSSGDDVDNTPGGVTHIFTKEANSSSGPEAGAGYKTQASAGATGTAAFTGPTSDSWFTGTVAFSPGSETISVPHLTRTPTLYAPSLIENLAVPHLTRTPTLYAPALQETLAIPHLTRTPTLYAPVISEPISVPHLTRTPTLYAPTVAEVTAPNVDTKPDTRLYLDATVSITTDGSQRDTDLTSSAPGGYETNSSRLAIDSPLTIELEFDCDNNDQGIIVTHGNTGDTHHGWRAEMDGSGNLVCSDDGGTLISLALPDVSASTEKFRACWAVEANPLTTGASDAFRSELTIHNSDQDSWSLTQADHAALTSSALDAFAVGGRYNGTNLSETYAPTIHKVRIGNRFHTSTEFREDFVALSTPATLEGDQPLPPVRVDKAAGAFVESEYAGPAFQLTAQAHTDHSRRLLGPVLFWMKKDPPDNLASRAASSQLITFVDDGTTWGTGIAVIKRRRIPEIANRLWVRMQSRHFATVGSPGTTRARFYTSAVKPGTLTLPGSTPDRHYIEATITRDDTSTGVGAWDFGEAVRVARDSNGWTWCYLAFSSSDKLTVHDVYAEPIIVPAGSSSPLEISLP